MTRHPFAGNIDCAERFEAEGTTREGMSERGDRIAAPTEDTLENAIERGKAYNEALAQRFEREAQTLARLTGQPVQPIRQRISNEVPQPTPSKWLVLHPKTEANTMPRGLGFWGDS